MEKVSHDKLMDFLLVMGVEILEFMQRFKALNVQSIGHDHLRFAFEQMFAFPRSDITHRSERVAALRTPEFYCLFGNDAKFLCFQLMVEKWQVCVKQR